MLSPALSSQTDRADDQSDAREANEALIAISVRQHELIQEGEAARRSAEELALALRASEEQLSSDFANMALLRDLGARLVTEESIQTIYEQILASAIAIMKSDGGTVQTFEAQTNSLVLIAASGFERSMTDHYHRIDVSCGTACGNALRTGGRIFIEFNDETNDDCIRHVSAGYRSAQAMPLVSRTGELLGMLNTHWCQAGRRADEKQLHFLDLLARQAADLIEQHRMETTLRESESFNRSVFESSPDCVKGLDGEGRLLRFNKNGLCVMEIDDFAPLAGCSWSELWPMEQRTGLQTAIEAARAGDVGRFQGRCPTVKGTDKWWDISVAAIRDAGGNVKQFIAVSRDITAHMQAESFLRESEERFRMVADNMSQLAWTCEKLGDVTWYNQRWMDYTGLSFETMKGWDWSKAQHPDHLDRVVAGVKRSAETGEPWEDTFPLRGKDDEYRWFLSRAVPIRDAIGNIVRWFGTNTDVTELREAQQNLGEADRRKSEFVAMLAHELRNPLAPLRNSVQVLRVNGGSGDAVRSTTEMMERQVGQMVRLVDDLLDVSRMNQGKIELRRERVELASIVHQAQEAVRPMVESADHQLTVTLPLERIYLDADPARLVQVVGNLLTNACKFTDKGGNISLTVETARRATSAAAEEAVVRIRDNGIGIAAEQLPRIFDMFMQVDTSLERSVSGLGIGLTLVKELVGMHAGSVEVISDGLGQGSEFVVRLPIAVETPSQLPEPTVSAVPPTKSLRILVVDDNRDSAESLAMLLKLTGNETHIAYDGIEAVEAAAAFAPDLVLLDIGLPKLNGYEACRRIRGVPSGKNMVLVALTGWGQDEDRQRSKDAGFDAHLVKPVDYAALTKLLNESSAG